MEMKKKTYASVRDAIAGGEIHHFTYPDISPDDTDWHQVITLAPKPKRKKDDPPAPDRYQLDTAFFTGQFWSLGTTKPAKPVKIYGYEVDVRMKRSTGPIASDEGALRLAEAVLIQWRKDYIAALVAYGKKPEIAIAMEARKIEHQIPAWLLPSSVTKEQVVESIQKDVLAAWQRRNYLKTK